jgi:threonine/homoserine/homoserine lactone efflux protein
LLDLVLKAIVTGFVLSIMIGPVFFLLLETSIRKGVRAALAFDLGVFLSDVIYIIVATIFYSQVASLTEGEDKYLVKIFGGLIFVTFGSFTLFKKPQTGTKEETLNVQQTKDYLMLCLKGFFLNFVNPAVIFYWFSVIAIGAEKKGESDLGDHIYIYIGILLLTFFSVDVLKIVGAKKLRPFITEKVLTGLNRLTGLIILCTGTYLFTDGILYAIRH